MRNLRSSLCSIAASTFLTAICLATICLATLSFAEAPDRITGPIDSSQMVALTGNISGLARPQFDQGRADASKVMSGVSLSFRPSAAQQAALDELLAQQQDRSSPNYHQWLTPAQFADRFGLSHNDVLKVITWLGAQGFQVTRVANSRNQIFFQGTVAQIETAFHTEIHTYRVNNGMHWGNSNEPSVPAALASMVIGLTNLHSFQPRPRIHTQRSPSGVRPNFTSYVSGTHYLAPGDFATIYQVQGLYTAGSTGVGQAIAIVGQSTVNPTDLSNFRSAAGLSANPATMVLVPGTGTGARCSGDEGESDLDLEWSGGVAKDATIVFVFVGLVAGDSCTAGRSFSAFDSIQYAVDQDLAPIISSSYGNCEANLGITNAQVLQGWAQQGNAQGQTMVSASGDSGAADCDPNETDPNGTAATGGLAVDLPAAIPEVTGAGGNEFFGDAAGTVTGTPPNTNAGNTPYWSGTTDSTDTISSALTYIPEEGWNDTVFDIANGGGMASSGGGKSTLFAKPTWQTGTGVPADTKRDVPDISLSASANHDAYLICSEDDEETGGLQTTCTSGFRDGAGGTLQPIGGTSAVAPTFSGILALVNQYLGNVAPAGLGNINPSLYPLLGTTAFNDVTTGSNIVPCAAASLNCPTTGTKQFGFSAGVGYDQVTGLGSVNAFTLAKDLKAATTGTAVALVPSATTISPGGSVTLTATVTPSGATGSVSFYANYVAGTATAAQLCPTTAACQPVPVNVVGGVATFTTTALTAATNNVIAVFDGTDAFGSATSAVSVITVAQPFTIAPSGPVSISAGNTGTVTIVATPGPGFTSALTYTCPAPPAGVTCAFNPSTATTSNPTLTISTLANMATGAIPVTVSATGGGATNTTSVALTVTATTQGFALSAANGTASVQVTPGQLGVFSIAVGSPTNGYNPALYPLTFTCSETAAPLLSASGSQCTMVPATATNTFPVTMNVTTLAATAQLRPPLATGKGIFLAALLPGLLGIIFTAGSRKRAARSLRFLSLIVVLGFSTVWLSSCSSNNSGGGGGNHGTPAGSYTITVNATTGGANPLTGSTSVTLVVQ